MAPDRRRHARYAVSAPLEVSTGHDTYESRIDDVSAGGVRLVPGFPCAAGTHVRVRDPQSDMALIGTVVTADSECVRVRFDSEEAGIIVSAWIRMSHESDRQQAVAGKADMPAQEKAGGGIGG